MGLSQTDMAWLSPCGEKSQSLQLGLTKGAPLRPRQEALFIVTGDTSDGDHYLVCADVAEKETISSLLPCVKTDTVLAAATACGSRCQQLASLLLFRQKKSIFYLTVAGLEVRFLTPTGP